MLLAAGSAPGGDLIACGDKFVMVSRGTRFQRPVTRTPAAVLIYANAPSASSAALADVTLATALRKVGYDTTTVTSAAALESALTQKQWNLIVADVGELESISALPKTGKHPVPLPVVSEAADVDLKRLKKVHRRILKVPARSQAFVDAVDAALVQPL